jgi:hypothetical protein
MSARGLFLAGVVALAATPAFAQESVLAPGDRPLWRALELAVGFGWSQGVGSVVSGQMSVPNVSGPGLGLEGDVGYRISPQLMLGLFVTTSQLSRGDAAPFSGAQTMTAGVQANYHFQPMADADPWLGLATGWRGMWASPASETGTAFGGVDLARIQLGVDFRCDSATLSPVIGVDLSMFLSESPPGSGFESIDSKALSAFFFGGLIIRFDALGRSRS